MGRNQSSLLMGESGWLGVFSFDGYAGILCHCEVEPTISLLNIKLKSN